MSRTNKLFIRGATLIRSFMLRTQQDTIISPATNVCQHVAEYSALYSKAFDCALSGPFDDLFFTRSQQPGLSVEASSPLSPRQRFQYSIL